MSNEVSTATPTMRLSRRRALIVGGGVLATGGALTALARGPRRADGLPARVDLATARALGDGFFLVEGWVLTAEDLEVLKKSSAPPAALP